jgi:hypothetical protein
MAYSCNNNTILNGPENPNLLASNYYFFSIKRIPNFTYFVQSANLPMISTRSINQPTTLGTYPKIPATNYYFDDLQVSFLVNADMKNWLEIYDWLKGIGNLKDDNSNLKYDPAVTTEIFSEATLLVTNSAYTPILQANFKYVFPKTLGGINFTTQNTSTDPITCSVNFAYSYYEIVPVGATGSTG